MENIFRPTTFMIVPTTACNASCAYCFAKKRGSKMTEEVIGKTIEFIEKIAPCDKDIRIIFHGGEPLLGGIEFYRNILPRLRGRFGRRLRLSMQSNLWNIDDEMIRLISEYEIGIGTSLDGYKEMCDMQRGDGYYERTSDSIRKLRVAGIHAGRICTFGFPNRDKAARVFESAEDPYAVHGAVRAIGCPPGAMTLDAEGMKQVLSESYHAYREHTERTRITTLDLMVKGCLKEKGELCSFFPCLGHFAAIAPDGSVYSCNRFGGYEEFCLGNVKDDLCEADILQSSAYKKLYNRQEHKKEACGDCAHFPYCNGGCLYTSFTSETGKDPYCEAYRAVFNEIRRDLALEMGAVLAGREEPTPLLCMAGERKHPYDEGRKKLFLRGLLDAENLGISPSKQLAYPENRLNQVFLNLTYSCPLLCKHCSACADSEKIDELPLHTAEMIVRDAIYARFRVITFTGGEPFSYSAFEKLMESIRNIDRKGTRFQLRTSLGFDINENMLCSVGGFFDVITVSVDGDREAHDDRRGKGRYDITVRNLKKLTELGFANKLILTAVLNEEQKKGNEWNSVKELGQTLGIQRVISRPLLPIGRNCDSGCTENFLPPESEKLSPSPKISCGLGMNIHIEPTGEAYPCYVCKGEEHLLGNLREESLISVLEKGKLYSYQRHTVDTNKKCKSCEVRYLCGGVCRAWLKNDLGIDSGDFDCSKRKAYYLGIAEMIKQEE